MPKENLDFDNSATVNSTGKPILGKLKGPCADIINATRNGRKYSKELWRKVFNDPIVKEYFDCGGIFGELGHPADREETDMEKIAICMPTPPQENSDGELIGSWDILNTPNGRIAKCLCDYGYKLGISSRGSGDTYTDYDGNESVDPDSYSFNAFDLVLLPAVKSARLEAVNESLSDKKSFRKAICEELESAKDDEKKIMTETLSKLHIDYQAEKPDNLNIDAKNESTEAVNDGADVIKDLQEALQQKQALESTITDLQEKLSVCYAKEAKQEELITKYKSTVINLSESAKSAKALQKKVSTLTEKVGEQEHIIEENQKLMQSLRESKKSDISRRKSLTESISTKDSEIRRLTETVKSLKESLAESDSKATTIKESLQESIADIKKDFAIKQTDYSRKLSKANGLVEKYKTIASSAVDRYISSQALKLGVDDTEIRNRLSESFTFDDIDKVCESLQEYKLNMSKLPFDITSGRKVGLRVTESKKLPLPVGKQNADDEVDSQLINLAGV